jgi:hypothetical protein
LGNATSKARQSGQRHLRTIASSFLFLEVIIQKAVACLYTRFPPPRITLDESTRDRVVAAERASEKKGGNGGGMRYPYSLPRNSARMVRSSSNDGAAVAGAGVDVDAECPVDTRSIRERP